MFSRLGNRQLATFLVAVLSTLLLWQGEFLHAQDSTAQIKALRKERSALLDEVVKQLTESYATGRGNLDMLVKAQDQALQAKLELAEGPEERIVVLRKLVENANKNVQVAENRFKAGVGQQYEVLQAKARVLEFRIELVKDCTFG